MNTNELLGLLNENKEKELVFEYAKGSFIPKAYHITEVKNVYFESVDCGGNEHQERQTVVQLWTNPIEFKNKYMETGKALSILEKVNAIKPLNQETEVFFEYGNSKTATSNYSVRRVAIEDDKVILKLYVQPTVCKPAQLTKLKEVAAACCGGAKCC